MNKLLRFTRQIEFWLKENSKTQTSFQVKRNILRAYYGLTKPYPIAAIAQENQVSRQYANLVIRQIQQFLEVEPRRLLKCLRDDFIRRLVELPALQSFTKLLETFKREGFLPHKMTERQFKSLMDRLSLGHYFIRHWQQLFFTDKSKGAALKELKVAQTIMEQQLKQKLIMTQQQLIQQTHLNASLVDRVIASSGRFILCSPFIAFNWPQQKRKTEFAYLIAKLFAIYQKLSADHLLKIMRTPLRIAIDNSYLSSLSDEQVITGLLMADLVTQHQGYFYAQGELCCVTPSEKALVAIIEKTRGLQARHIASLSKMKGWSSGGNYNSLNKSPLLHRSSDGWYRLYPHLKHSVIEQYNKQPKPACL